MWRVYLQIRNEVILEINTFCPQVVITRHVIGHLIQGHSPAESHPFKQGLPVRWKSVCVLRNHILQCHSKGFHCLIVQVNLGIF